MRAMRVSDSTQRPAGRKSFTDNFNEIELVAPTGFEPVFHVRHALS